MKNMKNENKNQRKWKVKTRENGKLKLGKTKNYQAN